MSGLCGWNSYQAGQSAGHEFIERMAATLARFDGYSIKSHSGEGWALACTSRSSSFEVYEDNDQIVAISGNPRLRTTPDHSLLTAAGSTAAALARAFAQCGAKCLELIEGEYSVAIIAKRAGQTLLAVDRMGTTPLYYANTGTNLVFGASADAINLHPLVNARIDAQGLYDYIYFHMVPSPGTIYSGLNRLLPGQYVLFSEGKISLGAYWAMNFDEHHKRPFAELREEFLSLLQSAVRNASAGARAGAFLSGGTDSSTLAGMLGKVTGQPPRTYSIGFEAEGYDEMGYARIAARHFGTEHHEYYVTPDDVVAAIPQIAAAHDQPFGNASAVPTYYCARLAKEDGIDTLLGGDGGDELFGGNERYAKQHLYSLYSDLPSFLRKGLIEPIAFALPEVGGIIGKTQRYMRNATQPMPARYDNYNLLERLGPTNVFTAEFLATVDVQRPQTLMAEAYRQTHAATLINRMLALDLKYTLADNDLPKVTRSCELAGVDVRFPMLDDALVTFSASLAPGLKLKGTRLRYFFKEALRGFLPDEIITKTKHGFGLPVGLWLQSHPPLLQLALDNLADLKRRNIIRPEFIDELTSLHVKSHAGYYGTMVWILIMLEQWFRQHRGSA